MQIIDKITFAGSSELIQRRARKCKKCNIALAAELCKVVQGLFYQGNAKFRETSGIQYVCVSLFATSYSTIKEIG